MYTMEIANLTLVLPFLALGLIFVIVGLIQLKFPPKKINQIYGYRTKSSMQNQEIWDFAQQFSAKEMVKGGFFFLVIAGIGTVVKLNEILGVSLMLILAIGFAIYLFNRTEKAIHKNFNT